MPLNSGVPVEPDPISNILTPIADDFLPVPVMQVAAPGKDSKISNPSKLTLKEKAERSLPATPKDAPSNVDFSSLNSEFEELWKQSFPDKKSQEQGGTLILDKNGKIDLVNKASGTSGSFAPNLNVSNGNEVVGIFHTHPYDASEGGYTGISLSGGDAGFIINQKHDFMIAQSGKDQFMYARTQATPDSVDGSALNDSQNQRMYDLMDEGYSFSDASKAAAKETAKKYKLGYYEGTDGKFKKVD